ncbi:MAG TPA: hypothetical protein VD837_16555 [Terriglobales bacterium]|nr:hypothetical protein [Terriglobales bacterium]
MKITRTFLLTWLLTVLGVGIYAADNVAASKGTPANPPFEKLKTLVGTWETKLPDGKTATGTVRLAGNGSALVIESAEDGMITVIHPDGESLMATHYCGAKNQPRYVLAPSKDQNTVAFQFKDVTNLASPEAGHMRGVVFTFLGADRHREDWTWRENGKDEVFSMEFTRKK